MDDIDFDDDFEAECIQSTKHKSKMRVQSNATKPKVLKQNVTMNTALSATCCEVGSEQRRGQYNPFCGNRNNDMNRYMRPENRHDEYSLCKIDHSMKEEMDFEDDDIDLQAIEEAERKNKRSNPVKTDFCSRINVNSDGKQNLGLKHEGSTLKTENPTETLTDFNAVKSEICMNTINVSETNTSSGLSSRLGDIEVRCNNVKPVNRSEKSPDHTLKKESGTLKSQSKGVQYLSPKEVQKLKKEQHHALKSQIGVGNCKRFL